MGNTMHPLTEPYTSKQTDRGGMKVDATVRVGERAKSQGGGADSCAEKHVIRFAASSMQGWRVTMEDAHLMIPSITVAPSKGKAVGITLENHALFAVFDGHGGDFTSLYAYENMLRVFTARKEMAEYAKLPSDHQSDVPGVQLLKSAMENTFLELDKELKQQFRRNLVGYIAAEMERRQASEDGRQPDSISRRQLAPVPVEPDSPEESGVEVPLTNEASTTSVKLDRSGSTAVAVLLTPSHIICANAGDSRAVLVKSGKALPLSFDHKPTNHVELGRINRAGGEVKMRRVDGDLAVSRGLGDFRFKDDAKLNAEKQKVSSKPDFIVTPRDGAADEFIVLACDGIWDVMKNADCAASIQSIMDEGETDVGLVCEELLDRCLELESRDNMTACMVALPACKIMSEAKSCSKGNGGVKALRERREATGLKPGHGKQAKMAAQAAVDALAGSPQTKNDNPEKLDGGVSDLALNSMVTEVAVQAPSVTIIVSD